MSEEKLALAQHFYANAQSRNNIDGFQVAANYCHEILSLPHSDPTSRELIYTMLVECHTQLRSNSPTKKDELRHQVAIEQYSRLLQELQVRSDEVSLVPSF